MIVPLPEAEHHKFGNDCVMHMRYTIKKTQQYPEIDVPTQ